jgi:predicted membrane channel-forming protein YqfA (hemolysin III family)
MNQSDKVLHAAGETAEYARQYVRQQVEYQKLELAERLAKATASMISIMTAAIFCVLVTSFLFIAAGLYLGKTWGNYPLAFLCIGGVIALIGVIFYLLRRWTITNPVLSLIIRSFFEEEDHE